MCPSYRKQRHRVGNNCPGCAPGAGGRRKWAEAQSWTGLSGAGRPVHSLFSITPSAIPRPQITAVNVCTEWLSLRPFFFPLNKNRSTHTMKLQATLTLWCPQYTGEDCCGGLRKSLEMADAGCLLGPPWGCMPAGCPWGMPS